MEFDATVDELNKRKDEREQVWMLWFELTDISTIFKTFFEIAWLLLYIYLQLCLVDQPNV